MAIGNAHIEPKSRMKREMSLHAQKRGCQRGIPPGSVNLVVAFGEPEHDNRGGIRYLMTDKALDNLRRVVGTSQKVDALAGIYAVVSATDSTIITVAHRH